MPTNEFGQHADIILDPISVFNRMNPSQFYEQYFNATAEFVQRRIIEMIKANPDDDTTWNNAFNLAIEFLSDINANYGAKVAEVHPTTSKQHELVDEIIRDGFYIQVTPFLKGVDQHLILKLKEKYGTCKTPVTFTLTDPDGTRHTIVSRKPVLIGYEYFYLLYKMPHMRSAGVGHVNQFHSPVRASALSKLQYPFSQTPIRLGEDEIRNLVMTSGVEAAAHILGAYANSPEAVENMEQHLYFDQHPSQLAEIDMSVPEIIKSNNIIGVTKHEFATVGINITPTPEEIAKIMSSASTVTEDETQTDESTTTVEEDTE